MLIVIIWFALKNATVQNWLGHKITDRLSNQLHTKVTLKKIGFSLFNNINIEGLYIEDKNKDTLLYAGIAQVKITDWFFFKDKADLHYIHLGDAVINTYRKEKTWNYQFILDEFASDTTKPTSNKKGIELHLKYISFKNIRINQKDEWFGENQNIAFEKLELFANDLDFNHKKIDISFIDIIKPKYIRYEYKSNFDITKIPVNNNLITKHWQLFGWLINIEKIKIDDGDVQIDKATNRPAYSYFDGEHLHFKNIDGYIEKINWISDTITLKTTLKTNEICGLEVQKLNAEIKAYPNTIEFNKLLLQTPNSTIKDKLAFSFNDFNNDVADFIHKVKIETELKNSIISSDDLAFFAPSLKSWNKKLIITGDISGTVDNFKSKNINIKTGNTIVKGNLVMTGLPNIKETFIDFNNGLIQTNYKDLITFIPSLNNTKGVALNKLNLIQYDGNYTGFINDFVTYGTLQTNLGTVKTDLNMKLKDGENPIYSGNIETDNFKLGSLLNDAKIGDIGFNGKITGTGFDINKLKATIDGTTSKFEYGDYTYKSITTIGKLENKKYIGKIITNDPNLIANIDGTIDFSKPIPYFDVKTKIEKSNFKLLQFTKDDYSLTGNVNLKFSASNLDDFDGTIKLDDATLKKDGEKLPFDYISIQSAKTKNGKEFFVTSNEFEGTVKGKFSFNSVINSFGFFLNKYYPTIFAAPKKIERNQNFEFDITTKNVSEYIKLLDKNIGGFNESHFIGSINTITNENKIYASVPFFSYTNKYQFNDLLFNGSGTLDSLYINGDIGTLTLEDNLHFYNTKVNIKTVKNESTFSLNSTGDKTLNALEVNGNIKIFKDGVEAVFNPSSFTVNNKKWELEKDGEVIIHNKAIAINDLKFVHNNQFINLKSELDGVENFYNIIADVKNIEVGDITPLFVKTNKFEGKFNGRIMVKDPLGKPLIETANAYIDDFVKDDEYIGKVDLSTKFDLATNNVDYTLKSLSPKYRFGVTGYYHPKDSTGTTISNKINLDCTNVKIIENYLSGVFKDIEGCANGELEIFGTEKKQYILGKVDISDSLKMTVKYTDVKYILQKGSIVFNARDIDFSGISIKDTLNNIGKINRGRIRHDGFFQNMDFDIDLLTDKMLLINTTRLNNETFYGSAIADANMKLKGPISNLKMKVLVNNPADAMLTLNTNAEGKTLGKADFIEFKTYGKEMTTNKKEESSNMDIELVLNANKNAKIKVVLDEIAGDNIIATGNGNIKINIASSGELKINGLYTVEDGKYDFSLTSLFRKPFVLQKGSTISWNGDPYNAAINLTATYNVPRVSLSDLPKSYVNTNAIAPIDLQVSALLTESLTKPKIKFGIDYINTTKNNDPEIDNVLDRLRKDENELNKQVGFLVLFDRLLPTSGTALTSGGTEVLANTLSKFLINKVEGSVNSILDKIFPNKNVKINIDLNAYSPGGIAALLDKRISSNIGLQINLLDNRTTFYFTGNLDFGLAATQNSVPFLPNFILEYKVRRDGSIIGTVFIKNGLDAIIQPTGGDRNRRISYGGGLAYRNEDDDFKNLFRKKRKKKA